MDWRESDSSNEQPLSDAELTQALSQLDTASAIELLEKQALLRAKLAAQPKLVEEQVVVEEQISVAQPIADIQEPVEFVAAEVQIIETPEFEAVFVETEINQQGPDSSSELAADQPVTAPAPASDDIAASLNAIFGATNNHSVYETPVIEVHNPQGVSAEEQATDDEEHQQQNSTDFFDSLLADYVVEDEDEPQVAAESIDQIVEAAEASHGPAVEMLGVEEPGALVQEFPQPIAAPTSESSTGAPIAAASAPTAVLAHSKSDSQGSSAWSLIFNWNGSGALLTTMAMGYLFAQLKGQFSTLLVGGFIALIFIGLANSLAAVAARRGHLPTQVMARAAFGVSGNIIPASLLLLARVAVLAFGLVLGSQTLIQLLPAAGLNLNLDLTGYGLPEEFTIVAAGAVILGLTALGISFIRGKFLAIARIVLSVATIAAIVSLLVLSAQTNQVFPTSLIFADITGAAVLAANLLVVYVALWGSTAADENQQLSASTPVAKLLGAGLLNSLIFGSAGLIAGYGAFFVEWNSALGLGLSATLGVLTLFALGSMVSQTSSLASGLRIKNPGLLAKLFVALGSVGLAAYLYLRLGLNGMWVNALGYLPVIGVPVAAWLGIICADIALRRLDYHGVSLDKNYGFYGGWHVGNVIGLAVISALGLGFVNSNLPEFLWTGYFNDLLSIDPTSVLAKSGVWIALALGFLLPLLTSIPRIKRQEEEVAALDARREALREITGLVD